MTQESTPTQSDEAQADADLIARLKAQVPYQGKSAMAFLCHEAAERIAALRAEPPASQSDDLQSRVLTYDMTVPSGKGGTDV